MGLREASKLRSVTKATYSEERLRLQLMALIHEPLLYLRDSPQVIVANEGASKGTMRGDNARHMGGRVLIWVSTKDGCHQIMRESTRANECWARQGDRVGDPKAAKTDREGSLLPSVSFQEGSTEDACSIFGEFLVSWASWHPSWGG